MPRPSTSTFKQAEIVEIVLVPFDHGAFVHGGVLDRHHLVEARARDREAADMLGQMAGKPHQLLRQRHDLLQPRVGWIEAGAARFLGRDAGHRPAPERAGERADRVVGQSEHLADLANGAAAPVADHGGGHAGMMTPIAIVDVLDDLLAALVLEVDVDVGRLAPFGGDEALEQQVDFLGIDLGDAEAITDHGVGRRPAALAQDAFRARKPHDVVDGQEVGRVFELGGDGELLVERFAHMRLHAVRIAAAARPP